MRPFGLEEVERRFRGPKLPVDRAAVLLLRALQAFAIYCPNTPTLRGTAPDPQMRLPAGLSGGGLAEAFQELRRTLGDGDRLEEVFALIDWVSDISSTGSAGSLLSPSVARGKYVLKLTDRFMKQGRNTLTAYDASEGALYVLFMMVLAAHSQSPRVFAVDNFDQALNPRTGESIKVKAGKTVRFKASPVLKKAV